MTYRDLELTKVSGPTRKIAWTLIAVVAAMLLFLAWHQVTMISDNRRYGIETKWFKTTAFFVAFLTLEAAAIWVARRQLYGVAIGLAGFAAAFLGLLSLAALVGPGL